MTTFLIIVIIVLVLAFIMILMVFFSIFFIFYTGVPYTPTPPNVIKKIIDALQIQEGQVVFDLGCGDGRFLFAAESAGARAVGFELSPTIYLKARLLKLFKGSRSKIYYRNFFSPNLGDADIIFCFLTGAVMERLEKKLNIELKTGAKVVSYGFFFPNWNVTNTILPDPEKDKTGSKIFIYQK